MKRLLVAVLVAWPLAGTAVEPHAPSDTELAMLPPFCPAKLKRAGDPQDPAWVSRFGAANWLHLHHYCFAVNFVNRARRARDAGDRKFKLQSAEGEYMYVVTHSEPGFWMRPQIYVELGKVHLESKNAGAAARWFSDAINFNPRYEAAYLAMIELQRQGGERKAALETASAGLGHLPASQRLQQAYLDLGGKEPFPEAIVKAEPKATPDEVAPPVTASGNGGSDGADAAAVATAVPAQQVGEEVQPGAENSPPVPEQGCRFCPPEEIQRRWRDYVNPSGDSRRTE